MHRVPIGLFVRCKVKVARCHDGQGVQRYIRRLRVGEGKESGEYEALGKMRVSVAENSNRVYR